MFGFSVCFLELLFLTLTGQITGHGNGPGDVKVVVEEGSDVILPCSLDTMENIGSELFDWKKDGQQEVFLYDAGLHYNNGRPGQDPQFKGRVSHFPDQLQHGNASIKIHNSKMADSGNYTCIFPLLQPNRKKFHIELVVAPVLKDRSGEISGATRQPFVSIVGITDFGVQLKCEVRDALPQPKLQWQDSDGKNLSAEEPQVSKRGEHFDISLQTTVTKTPTNRFHCVVTQEEIGHRNDANITVPEKLFEDTCSKVDVTGWFAGFLLGVFTVAIAQTLLVAAKIITVSCNKGFVRQKNVRYEAPADSHERKTGNSDMTGEVSAMTALDPPT